MPVMNLDADSSEFYDSSDITVFDKYIIVVYYAILMVTGNELAP